MPLAVIEAILVLSPDGISTACLEWEWIEEEIQWKNQRGERPEENWKRHFSPLIREIRDIVQKARLAVTQNVNSILVVTNFEIGRRIVEHEQQGEPKAGYGKQTIQELSHQLTEEFGRGFSKRNLEYMRRFYLEYCGSAPPAVPCQSDTVVSAGQPIAQTLSAQFTRFALSWSHYIFLMNIDNLEERRFYGSRFNIGDRLAKTAGWW